MQLVQTHAPELAVIELVHAMPKQGVSSVWNFGVAFGMARGVISGAFIPTHLVSPTKWKKHFGLDSDKEKARALAISKWPECAHFNRKKDHGRAEAALLALYGAQTLVR
jgi:crossover junction endodeoxyribonuclease RuvC